MTDLLKAVVDGFTKDLRKASKAAVTAGKATATGTVANVRHFLTVLGAAYGQNVTAEGIVELRAESTFADDLEAYAKLGRKEAEAQVRADAEAVARKVFANDATILAAKVEEAKTKNRTGFSEYNSASSIISAAVRICKEASPANVVSMLAGKTSLGEVRATMSGRSADNGTDALSKRVKAAVKKLADKNADIASDVLLDALEGVAGKATNRAVILERLGMVMLSLQMTAPGAEAEAEAEAEAVAA